VSTIVVVISLGVSNSLAADNHKQQAGGPREQREADHHAIGSGTTVVV